MWKRFKTVDKMKTNNVECLDEYLQLPIYSKMCTNHLQKFPPDMLKMANRPITSVAM